MPFSMNRQFKKAPRLLARAEGMYYYTPEGRKILDGTAGCGASTPGHCRKKIVDAVAERRRDAGFRAAVPDGPPARVRVRDR
jgi:beta-alanine--pyruvate transaminase